MNKASFGNSQEYIIECTHTHRLSGNWRDFANLNISDIIKDKDLSSKMISSLIENHFHSDGHHYYTRQLSDYNTSEHYKETIYNLVKTFNDIVKDPLIYTEIEFPNNRIDISNIIIKKLPHDII